MRGCLVTLGILTTLTAMAAFKPAALAGQSTAAKKPWTLTRTPWGEPDLQGKWSYATITPLERPNGQASKEILSGEEVAALNEGARTDADRRDGGAEADLARAYNAYWYDRGKSIGRTSRPGRTRQRPGHRPGPPPAARYGRLPDARDEP